MVWFGWYSVDDGVVGGGYVWVRNGWCVKYDECMVNMYIDIRCLTDGSLDEERV